MFKQIVGTVSFAVAVMSQPLFAQDLGNGNSGAASSAQVIGVLGHEQGTGDNNDNANQGVVESALSNSVAIYASTAGLQSPVLDTTSRGASLAGITVNGHEQGTGGNNDAGTGEAPDLEVVLSTPRQAVVMFTYDNLTVMGRVTLERGFGQGILDGYNTALNDLRPDWGQVEILVGFYSVDVIVYQNVDGEPQEVFVQSLALEDCLTSSR